MARYRIGLAFVGMALTWLFGCAPPGGRLVIVCPRDATGMETLAAREVQRYVYLRTGELTRIIDDSNAADRGSDKIVVASKDRDVVRQMTANYQRLPEVALLEAEHYLLKTIDENGCRTLLVTGGDPVGTLYGAYRFCEHLGIRYYLHGDVVPEEKIPARLPELNERASPLFSLRGIQPFHDFPEGPDFWSVDGYKAVITQLPKLRMNFIGFHTYPAHGGAVAEPMVWIGLPEDVNSDGTVKFSYPSGHFSNMNGTWGYEAKVTSDYSFGCSQLFEQDAYCQDVQSDVCPKPVTPEQCNEMFDKFADKLRATFEHARSLGVKTCVGTEVPLTVPSEVINRIGAPKSPADWERLYEGIFLRMMRTHPLDYYWFWTPEGWTWKDVPESVVEATLENIQHAIAAAKKVNAPFRLATCGWVLGPQYDRALFDKRLPKDLAMSCISRAVGHDPVEPGFAQTLGRDKWAIPWLEDDPAMISPQLWVGRMRKDAVDAHAYGCNGLMGIHWHTRILGPNVSALAQAAWSQSGWPEPTTRPDDPKAGRFLASVDFYADWALHMFGPEAADRISQVFARIDGHLPMPSTWINGPGGIKPDPRPFEEVSKEYTFVEDLAALRPDVKGAGNLERFDYWLNQFRYMKANARVNCLWDQYNKAMAKVEAEKDTDKRKQLAREIALPVRKELIQAVSEVYRYLLATVSNTGEMGTIINWEQHIVPGLLERPGEALSKVLGEPLPADAMPISVYTGPARMFVPEIRTAVSVGEPLDLKVIVLAPQMPHGGTLYWRELGNVKYYNRLQLKHVARGVWSVQVPAEATQTESYEYYIEMLIQDGKELHFPVTAPSLNQTVVVAPADL